ncbi:hypothetical protein ACFFMN_28575 [Planobispora siamensis]|uniref:Uncharacterized protein n=1 Tax=Planobispora siamensis TaxID=936338 RepID=A0A8J3WMQ2_9ACTN|nr:hypothetical protein [Planobispora siamensis]GIH96754.1 hypothetical protein Psi01_73840 [Planobispora siamensis]
MILISAGLVLTAVVLLIAGVVLAKPFLVMWSIAVSVLSAVFLVIGALLRRHELFPGKSSAGTAPPLPYGGPATAGPMPAPHMATSHQHRAPVGPPVSAPPGMGQAVPGVGRTPSAATGARPVPAAGSASATRQGVLDADAIVLVIPGRRRYHVAGCRQLAGREHEELTHEEAREEGFTPCTTCLPEFTAAAQDAPVRAQEPTRPQAVREPGPAESRPQTFGESGPTTAEPRQVSGESGSTAAALRQVPGESGPAESRPQTFGEPGSTAAEPAAHEATARFSPPYGPVTPAARRPGAQTPAPSEAATSSQQAGASSAQPSGTSETGTSETGTSETGASEQPQPASWAFTPATQDSASPGTRPDAPESEGPVARPYVHGPESADETTKVPPRSQEPVSPFASPSFPIQTPAPSPAPATEDSGATSWFSRDVVPPPASAPQPPAASEPPVAPEPEATSPALPRPSAPEDPADSAEPAAVGPESPAARERTAAEPTSEDQQDPTELVGPTGTVPGRAGQPVPVGSTSETSDASASAGASPAEEEAPRQSPASSPGAPAQASPAREETLAETLAEDDTDTPPEGIPVVRPAEPPQDEAHASPEGIPAVPAGPSPDTVKVIVGTRRFHSSACPLVKGVDDGGLETMSLAEAEEAGLSSCSVCEGGTTP